VPFIAGRELRGQGALTIVLLMAVAIVVFGSLAGEYAGARGWLGDGIWHSPSLLRPPTLRAVLRLVYATYRAVLLRVGVSSPVIAHMPGHQAFLTHT
jgi:hypothetical protein